MIRASRTRSMSPLRPRKLQGEPLESRRVLATLLVSNLDPSGPGSLHQAVLDANQTPGLDQIVMQSHLQGTIAGPLTISITDDVEVIGPGHDLDVDWAMEVRGDVTVTLAHFQLDQLKAVNATITLDDMLFSHSHKPVDVRGSNLEVVDSVFMANTVTARPRGGAISAHSSHVEVRNSHFIGNTSIDGGAINVLRSSLDISGSTFEENSSQGHGGALFGSFADVKIRESSFLRNDTTTGEGGAVMVASGGKLSIHGSLFHQNYAHTNGTICSISGFELVNSTVSDNRTDGAGTAVAAANAVLISGSTLVNNQAVSGSLLGLDLSGAHQLTIVNSVITGNGSLELGEVSIQVDHSLIGSAHAATNMVGTDVLVGVDPLLDVLADNGGDTRTHAPLPGSPLIDAGAFLHPDEVEMTDQRGSGYLRVFGSRPDMGAIEYQPSLLNADVLGDGVVEPMDLEAIISGIASGAHDAALDLSRDGQFDLFDRNAWLVLAGAEHHGRPYQLGDANLDGSVDADDFVVWYQHALTHQVAWAAGDLNASGTIDGHDFILWNRHFQAGAVGVARPIASSSQLGADGAEREEDRPAFSLELGTF